MSHPADSASVSGRMEPRPGQGLPDAAHAIRFRPDLEFRGAVTRGVIRVTCDCGSRTTLTSSYLWTDFRDRVAIPHETGQAP